MARDDEKVTQTDILQQIAATLAQVQQSAGRVNNDALEKMTATLSELATRTRPENPDHNGISAYSYPEGDFKRRKPSLKCEMHWVGYPLTEETLTPVEIELLNTLEPGAYQVTKANRNKIPFTVEAKRKLDGTYERLQVNFPCKGDQSSDHRSMTDYIREAMGEKIPTLEELMAEISRLKEQNATLTAVVEAV